MRLLRVQVPEFRALKDVDITFEKDFTPAVFPIGSQNGGGKSTLLQLIFTLLHCPFYANREKFLQNILQDFKVSHDPKLLAKLSILDADSEIVLEFYTVKNKNKIDFNIDNKSEEFSDIEFSCSQKLEELKNDLNQLEKSKKIAQNLVKNISSSDVSRTDIFDEFIEAIDEIDTLISVNKEFIFQLKRARNSGSKSSLLSLTREIPKIIHEIDKKILQVLEDASVASKNIPIVSAYLENKNFNFVCTYESKNNKSGALLCRHQSKEKDIELLFEKISKKIFLTAPSTQVFIFSSKDSQKLLFKRSSENHPSFAKSVELDLPGLFAYEFIPVDLLIDAFKIARDQDFKIAVQSGKYGHSYQDLINALNLMLGSKKINVSPELSEITFKLLSDSGEEIDLYPENLSHGELKRLSLYMWLRSRLIEDSIVLMDEVEIAFHPDWQYQIVSDLAHWAPTNQYILATHSYELCQAVTPAHVKELEPKLLKAES